ncbi:MAG: transporter substrate-binding domain-containing protein [Oscillospiraceae bacterium]|jgi:polar amino acid transport system substrate-binding protein|nr:transporter substrate-binding domain-containing protein [Oscillospiraceae bacterium]
MKRIISLALTGVLLIGMVVSLASCSGGSGDSKLVCGITAYEPMNYRDGSGNWTGFDTEFAALVAQELGMKVEYQEIEWGSKYSELEAGTINCIWNGFTANTVETDTGKSRSEYVDFSYSYMLNQQCVVIKAERAGEFASAESLAGKTAAAEKGSAGETFAVEAVGEAGAVVDSAAQVNTFIEVKSGAVDFAVVDILLAKELAGSGDYSDLAIAGIELPSEVYAVGFKKGSDLTEKVNGAMKTLSDNGKLAELAEKYGLENSLQLDTSFAG